MNIRQFMLLIRIPSLSATVVPLTIGAALSLHSGIFNSKLWLYMFVAALFMQIGANVFNEHGDYVNNTDRYASHGFAGVIVKGEATPTEVLTVAIIFYILAALLAIPLILARGLLIAVLGLISATIGVLYSEGPYPLSRTPLGEIIVGITMGLIEILATEIVSIGMITISAYIVSVPVSLLVASILIGNNTRDIVKDREAGRRTLSVLLGEGYSRILFYSIIILSYIWIIIIYIYTVRTAVLFTFLTLPFPVLTLILLNRKGWKYSVEVASLIYLVYGIVLAVTLMI